VTSIDNMAFSTNTSLTKVTIHAPTPPRLGLNVFQNTPRNMQIEVPEASVNAYRTAPGWSAFEAGFPLSGSGFVPLVKKRAVCGKVSEPHGNLP
jgi:hypothetical protein